MNCSFVTVKALRTAEGGPGEKRVTVSYYPKEYHDSREVPKIVEYSRMTQNRERSYRRSQIGSMNSHLTSQTKN